MILWLEDQKIRLYPIDGRKELREVDDQVQWNKAYEVYKENLGCPKLQSKTEELAWIMTHAIRLEYFDRADSLKELSWQEKNNEFDSIDLNSEEFEQNVRKLGKMLDIAEHPDHFKVFSHYLRTENCLIMKI